MKFLKQLFLVVFVAVDLSAGSDCIKAANIACPAQGLAPSQRAPGSDNHTRTENPLVSQTRLPVQEHHFQLTSTQWVLLCSGFRNDCFFNAIRHHGIDISRQALIELLEANRVNIVWQRAVQPLALRELLETDLVDNRLIDLANYFRQFPNDIVLEDDNRALLYQFFIDRIRANVPLPFLRFEEENLAGPDLLELLGHAFGFDVRIVETTRTGVENEFRVIRFFNHNENSGRRRITLRYTSGRTGHFDLIADQAAEQSPLLNIVSLYRHHKILGKGAQGTVHLVHDKNREIFAIKVISLKHPKVSENGMLRFAQNEIHALTQLQHPNIPAYRESFRSFNGALIAIVQEYIKGESLKEKIRNRQISGTDVPYILQQIASALQHVHQKGFTHGDLKPANILLTSRDRVHLIDFGLSFEGVSSDRIGSPLYFPPEKWRAESHSTPGDIWAFGIILYELIHSKRPFSETANTHDELLNLLGNSVCFGVVPDLNSDDSRLNGLFRAMLDRDPKSRPTAQEILQTLNIVLKPTNTSQPSPSS